MSEAASSIRFVSSRNPVQRVNKDLCAKLVAAQENAVDRAFSNAAELCAKVFDDLGMPLKVPDELGDKPAREVSDLPYDELARRFKGILGQPGVDGQSARSQSERLARRTQLVRAFAQPDEVMARITAKVCKIIRTFPHTASDIERGRNPGDVLDPLYSRGKPDTAAWRELPSGHRRDGRP